jgi:hypothetical protein
MKRIFRLFVLAMMATAVAVSCNDKEDYVEPTLDVTPNNIAGCWSLDSWSGGELSEGSYVYIDFVRADKTYTLYQNIDSQYMRAITGHYFIYTDDEKGAIIRGNYDYGNGDWSHRYVVTELTEGRMVWTALDNPADVSVYIRATLPSDLQ